MIRIDNYKIHRDGRVYSLRKGKFMKPLNNGNGYFGVSLHIDGKINSMYIHRLVAIHFLPNSENKKYIDHIDRDKTNNHVSNLRWVTAKENTDNTAGKPRYTACRKVYKCLTDEQKTEIVLHFVSGMGVMDISRFMGIPRQTVSRYTKGH